MKDHIAISDNVWEIGSANGLAAGTNYNLYKPHSGVLWFARIAAQCSQLNRWSPLRPASQAHSHPQLEWRPNQHKDYLETLKKRVHSPLLATLAGPFTCRIHKDYVQLTFIYEAPYTGRVVFSLHGRAPIFVRERRSQLLHVLDRTGGEIVIGRFSSQSLLMNRGCA